MAIKSKIVESKKKEGINYPCLMKSINSGVIVLFTTSTSGVVIAEGSSFYKIGESSNNWCSSSFEPFYGSIILSFDGDA